MGRASLHTPLCDRLGIRYPILLAGMGRISCPELVAAVSNAGGLGILGGAPLRAETLNEWIEQTRRLTSAPFGVDTLLPARVPRGGARGELKQRISEAHREFARRFKERHGIPEPARDGLAHELSWEWTHDFFARQLEVIMDQRVPVYAAGLGDPSPFAQDFHARGMQVLGIAGNVKHVRRMHDGGVDVIVAQGTEAGGHNGRIGTMALVPQAVDAAGDTPVVAAGASPTARARGGAGAGRPASGAARSSRDARGGALGLSKEAMLESDEEDGRQPGVTGKPMRPLEQVDRRVRGLGLGRSRCRQCCSPRRSWPAPGAREDICATAAGLGVGLLHDVRPAAVVVREMVGPGAEILGEAA
jgi:hypothetical protein